MMISLRTSPSLHKCYTFVLFIKRDGKINKSLYTLLVDYLAEVPVPFWCSKRELKDVKISEDFWGPPNQPSVKPL